MTYTIGICDDQQNQIDIVKKFINEYPTELKFNIIDSTSPTDFIKTIENEHIDLFLLDVDMGKNSGIDLGAWIQRSIKNPIIVYITGYEKYAVDAFRLRAFHYLLKPVLQIDFNKMLDLVVDKFQERLEGNRNQTFIVKTKKEIVCINCEDIYYFEKIGHKIRVCAKNQEILYYNNLTNLLTEVDSKLFVRCHQGYVVNIEKVKSLKNKILYLYDNLELPVSRSYINNVKIVLGNRLFR